MKPSALKSAVVVVCLAVSGLSAQPEYQGFVAAFSKAMSYNDERGMDRAVRSSPRWVVYHYEVLYRQWLNDQTRVERRKTLAAVNASFKRVYDGAETLDKIGKYWDDMDDARTKALDKVLDNYDRLGREWDLAMKEKKAESMRKIAEQTMDVARRFEELGHALNAAKAWANVGLHYRDLPDRSIGDRRDSVSAITRFIENRKLWNWTKDTFYYGWTNWLKSERVSIELAEKNEAERKKAGFKEESKGPEAFIIPGAKEEFGKLVFKPLRQPLRSCFIRGGPVPALWMSVYFSGPDVGPVQAAWYRRSDIFLVRVGATKFGVTWDAATKDLGKNPWQKIDAPNKISKKPSVFYLDKGKRFKYAMWFYTCSQQEPVVGLATNLAPTREKGSVYYRSAASWETTLNGVKVTFLDDNADGKLFTEDPIAYGWKERTLGYGDEEKPVPSYDSMIIGKGKPVPYTSWVKLGDKWFHLKESGGTTLGAGIRPVHTDFFKVGTVQMSFAGRKAKPNLLIVRGKGDFRYAAFDISSGKPVEVPVGEYSIDYGRVIQGKGARTIVADIFAGDAKTFEVKEGKNTVLELGAPFKIDFESTRDQGQVVVDSLKFKVKGRGGEHYARISGGVAAPEVLYGKTKDGKGAKVVGEFIPIADADTLNTAGDTLTAAGSKVQAINVGFFAIVKGDRACSTMLKFIPRFPDGHVGLRQRKHKLFGKLEPNFK